MKFFIEKKIVHVHKKAYKIIKAQIAKKPDSLIGLAVGKTMDALYTLVSKDAKNNSIFWRKVKLFQIDENLGISPNSTFSFNHEVRKELKELIKIINPKNLFLINGQENLKFIIKQAYGFIKKNKGFDLIILGLGPEYDPHIAYNTTGKSFLNSKMRVVDLHPKLIESIKKKMHKGTPGRVSKKGITLGIKDILEAKKILLIAYGKEKAKSIKLAFSGKVNLKKASASALQLHKDLIVVVDKHAGLSLQGGLKSRRSNPDRLILK